MAEADLHIHEEAGEHVARIAEHNLRTEGAAWAAHVWAASSSGTAGGSACGARLACKPHYTAAAGTSHAAALDGAQCCC